VHTCRAMISPTPQRCGGIAPVDGVLEWKDIDFLGRTGRGDKEQVSPSMSVTSWSVWSSAWRWIRSNRDLLDQD